MRRARPIDRLATAPSEINWNFDESVPLDSKAVTLIDATGAEEIRRRVARVRSGADDAIDWYEDRYSGLGAEFQLVVLTSPGELLVVAVMHERRRPGYWSGRLIE